MGKSTQLKSQRGQRICARVHDHDDRWGRTYPGITSAWAHVARCDSPTADHHCGHLWRLWRSSPSLDPGPAYFLAVARRIAILTTVALLCPAAQSMLSDVISKLAGLVHRHLEGAAEPDPEQLQRQRRFRGRFSGRFRRHCMVGLLKKRRCRTPGEALGSLLGNTGRIRSKAWVRQDNAKYLTRAAAAFGQNGAPVRGAHALCPDGSRHGRPGKEYMVTPLWKADGDVAMWMPPGDRWGGGGPVLAIINLLMQ